MKKNYFFFLFIFVSAPFYAQSICTDAQSDVIYAYSHVKTAYDANNLTHLKEFSMRSFEAFERAKTKLQDCNCEDSYNAAYDSAEALNKVEQAKTYEDGRFYVKKARELAKASIEALEVCTAMSNEDEALVELQSEQFKLKQQQIELQLKEEKIKLMLAEKEEKAIQIQKDQLIETNEEALRSSINAFNDVLEACGCSSRVSNSPSDKTDMSTSSISSIKIFYLNTVKQVTSNYLTILNQCNIK